MPSPAIAINGYQWDYYIFFEMNNNLVQYSRVKDQHRLTHEKGGECRKLWHSTYLNNISQHIILFACGTSAQRHWKNVQTGLGLTGYGLLSLASPTANLCLFFLGWTSGKERSTPSDRNGTGKVQDVSPSQFIRERINDSIMFSKSGSNQVSKAHLPSSSQNKRVAIRLFSQYSLGVKISSIAVLHSYGKRMF